jgi:DNA invertase Pin-like site-specific DNA recombinase
LRRSTSRQEKSLADQRKEIERYAAEHGYNVVRWYQDDGISGDATEKRAGFLALHKAACNGRDFDVILVWDQDRFGRFNSLEAGYWIHPLMRAGVRLDTVTDGPINWDDFTGRVMYGLKQEGKYQFLRDLSRNVARGQISNAQKGYLCGQAAPYGYDRMLVNEAGEHVQRVHNGEQFTKPRSWHVTLVESDNPEKVATLKWLFRSYAETDTGLRSLADDLNVRGIEGPNGGLWHMGTIREILRNEAYVGDFVWAKRRLGKYHRVAAGEINERPVTERLPNGEPRTKRNDEAEWIVRRNAHPALIDRKTFARVQEKLTERKGRKGAKSKCGDGYILTGLVHCAHCGAKMYGTKLTVKRHGKQCEST